MENSRRTSLLAWGSVLAGVPILFWFAPPFHVVDLKASREKVAAASFNPGTFVEKLWNGALASAAEQAVEAPALLSAIEQDPKAAHEKYARSAGLGSSYFYFLRGQGRVLAIDKHTVSLAVNPHGATADVVLETGNIFGNAIRDGSGVLNVSDFPDSQDFNAISSEINRRVEQQVLPPLRKSVTVGATVRFAGCAEITDEAADLHPLRVVPLSAAVR